MKNFLRRPTMVGDIFPLHYIMHIFFTRSTKYLYPPLWNAIAALCVLIVFLAGTKALYAALTTLCAAKKLYMLR